MRHFLNFFSFFLSLELKNSNSIVTLIGDARLTAHYRLGVGVNAGLTMIPSLGNGFGLSRLNTRQVSVGLLRAISDDWNVIDLQHIIEQHEVCFCLSYFEF